MTPNQIASTAIALAKDNREYWKSEVRMMTLCPDITACSKSVTVNSFTITLTIEKEEEEL